MIRYGGAKFLIAGLVVLAFGGATMWANRSGRVDEVAAELVEVSAPAEENEGRLVLVSGTPELMDGGVIEDEEAGLRVEDSLFYSRVPYQLVYVERSREVVVDKGEDINDPTDDETRTEYYVAKEWIPANHDRDEYVTSFPERYENPPASNLSAYHASSDLRVSGFKVSASAIATSLQTRREHFTPEELGQACGEYITRSELALAPVLDGQGAGMLSSGDEVGDVHVLFEYEVLEGADPVTIVGRQRGNSIVPEEDDLVTVSESVQPGMVSKEEFLSTIGAEDTSSRKFGIGELVAGVVLVLLSLDWSRLLGRRASRSVRH